MKRGVLFVETDPERAAPLLRAYGSELVITARSFDDVQRALREHAADIGGICVSLEWNDGSADNGRNAKDLLIWARENVPKVARFVYAKYAEIPRAISLGLKELVPSVLAVDGNVERGAEIMMRTIHGKKMVHYEVTEQQLATLDAEVLFGAQVVRLFKLTADMLGSIPGAVIRNMPRDAGDRHVEFVLPMNAEFDKLRCTLPQWWNWPVKERHQVSGNIDNPVVKMFAALGPRQEIFVRKVQADEYVYIAIMPWKKRKRATLLVGVLTRAASSEHRQWLETCHRRALRAVGEYYLPRLARAADSLMKVRYTQEYDWVITDGYAGPDRRAEPTTFVNRHVFVGKRKVIPENVRELAGGFVDTMPKWVLVSVIAYLSLSLVDTVLTWVMVSSGKVVEMNPLLRPLIGKRALMYIVVKNGLSLTSIFVVARFHLFRLGRVVLPFNVFMYVALDLYWLWLLFHVR